MCRLFLSFAISGSVLPAITDGHLTFFGVVVNCHRQARTVRVWFPLESELIRISRQILPERKNVYCKPAGVFLNIEGEKCYKDDDDFFVRPLNYVPDTSASLNDFHVSWYIWSYKAMYLLNSNFQPQEHKKRVYNHTWRRFCQIRWSKTNEKSLTLVFSADFFDFRLKKKRFP